jgi:hypothetical protein
MAVPRIDVAEARQRLVADPSRLLVCAYDDEAKCRDNLLEGALTRQDFEGRVADLPRDREVVFYCA